MRLLTAALAAAALLAGAASATPVHPCADDARAKAANLLALHFEGPEAFAPEEPDPDQTIKPSVGDEVKVLPPVKALVGKGKLDVLEVYGYIYKATYRMRFIYAQIPETCALMGQEILEESDPY